eukprot:scaffold7092_cov262-Pinguiococcus_pyrenoidosus.AAC.23
MHPRLFSQRRLDGISRAGEEFHGPDLDADLAQKASVLIHVQLVLSPLGLQHGLGGALLPGDARLGIGDVSHQALRLDFVLPDGRVRRLQLHVHREPHLLDHTLEVRPAILERHQAPLNLLHGALLGRLLKVPEQRLPQIWLFARLAQLADPRFLPLAGHAGDEMEYASTHPASVLVYVREVAITLDSSSACENQESVCRTSLHTRGLLLGSPSCRPQPRTCSKGRSIRGVAGALQGRGCPLPRCPLPQCHTSGMNPS